MLRHVVGVLWMMGQILAATSWNVGGGLKCLPPLRNVLRQIVEGVLERSDLVVNAATGHGLLGDSSAADLSFPAALAHALQSRRRCQLLALLALVDVCWVFDPRHRLGAGLPNALQLVLDAGRNCVIVRNWRRGGSGRASGGATQPSWLL